LRDLVGRAGVRRRLYDLFFDVGYHRYALGQYPEAHPYFWRALGCVPTSRLALLHWLTTFLPTVVINRIRSLKQGWWSAIRSLAHSVLRFGPLRR
jgi:hypothetical protein